MSKRLTTSEFMEKYGEALVKFSSYYNYVFTYTAELKDGSVLQVGYGGSPDDIYRHKTSYDDVIQVEVLKPSEGQVYKDHKLIEHFYDY